MSQRSAPSAAASATALVSEPPRPSVATRLSGATPWKPATTATWPCSSRSISRSPVDVDDARRAVGRIGLDRDLPAQPGAGVDAHLLQRDRQQPGGDLLAGRHHRVVFAGVVQRRRLARPRHQLVGQAGHGRDHHRHLWPASTSRFTCRATFRMRAISATDVPPNFMTRRAITLRCRPLTGLPEKARFHSGLAGPVATGDAGRLDWHDERRRRPHRRPGRGRPLFRPCQPLVGRRRADAPAAPAEPAAACPGSRARSAAVSAATRRRRRRSPASASSMSAAAPGWSPSRWRAWAPTVVGIDPAGRDHRRGKAARRRGRARHRLPRHHRRGPGGRRRTLRRGADPGGGRARHRRRRLRRHRGEHGEARRADRRLDHQPHAQGVPARHPRRRSTCCAGCRAAPTTTTSW